MKVHAVMAGKDGSAFYRVHEPGRVATGLGVEWSVDSDVDVDASVYADGRTEVREVKVDCDVLVVQRPLRQAVHEVIRAAKRQGIAVVVEIDDDFHNLHPDHVGLAAVDPKRNLWHNTSWLRRSTQLADIVTVSTPQLAKYARRPDRAVVVRNYLPARALDVKPDYSLFASPAVGWTGIVSTHPSDLASARGLMADSPGVPFRVVGDDSGVASALGVPPEMVSLAYAWTDTVDGYWQAVADSIRVGVAPLQITKFNKAKSWLKPLEFAALGIPSVVSPTPEYRAFAAQSGASLVATSGSTWAFAVKKFLDNPEPYASNGREFVEEHSIEAHAGEWVAAWERALEVHGT